MITNSDITIYNKVFDKGTRLDTYQRTVIEGVFWNEAKAYIRLQRGTEADDKLILLIPFTSKASRRYVEPVEFKKLDYTLENYTLSVGDRVVKGVVDFEVVGKLSELDKEYEAYTITSVDTKDFGSYHLRHFSILAK